MTDLIVYSELCVSEHLHRPSPKVAAGIWRNGKLEARAYRGEDAPGEHAEFVLLQKKLENHDLRGATLITTLEPCTTRSHPKRPCADWIIQRGISAVYIGMVDPNHDIRGNGIIGLQTAGVECQLFPHSLSTRIEGINTPFSREFRPSLTSRDERITAYAARSLDKWYQSLNRVYWDRNSREDLHFFLSHLMEMIGGLSGVASGKIKAGVTTEQMVQKALAWWLALCGRAGIESVEEMVLQKFPYACPYCQACPHEDDPCRAAKRRNGSPDWAMLEHHRSELEQTPGTLSEWLLMFRKIYPIAQSESYGPSFARLTEELGELAEAVRLFDESPKYFLSEAADVFAWLMRIENIRESKADTGLGDIGRTLAEGFADNYPDACLDCESRRCRCPAVLKRTIGRIAKEGPSSEGKAFMTSARRRNVFGQ